MDSTGHPVAGAAIEMDGPTQGVTDTFGEWRSFVRLMPGGKLKVKLTRNVAEKKVQLQRTVSVPDLKSKGQEPNIKVNITFTKEIPAKRSVATTPLKAAAGPVAVNDEARSAKASSTDASLADVSSAGASSAGASSAGSFREDELSSVSVRFIRPALSGYSAGQMHGQMSVADELLPALKKLLVGLGATILDRSRGEIDLSLSYVPVAGHPGMVLVNMEYMQDDKKQHASFIKDAGEPPVRLAQRIVSSIKIHLAKSYRIYKEKDAWYVLAPTRAQGLWRLAEGQILLDPERQGFSLIEETLKGGYRRLRVMTGRDEPCNGKLDGAYCILTASTLRDAPPITGWKLLRLKIADKLPPEARLFASGFEGTRLNGGQWEYWGEPGGTHNITVLAGGRVVMRSRVKDPAGGVALIGGAPVAIKKRNTFLREAQLK